MKESYYPFPIDEIFLILLGIEIFSFPYLYSYRVIFMISVVVYLWLKIRYYENKIHKKEQEIYNIYYDKCAPMTQQRLDGEIKKARKPMYYELDQLKYKRKFLVDKLVIVNLIFVVLIEIFIR